MEFNFLTTQNIILKRQAHAELGKYIVCLGARALILHTRSLNKAQLSAMEASLISYGISVSLFQNRSSEPSPDMVDEVANAFIKNNCDILIAVGGGSVIDTGKAVCGLVTNGGNLEDYLEGVGTGKRIVNDPVPFVAVPTTHGTGAEATKNAVIGSAEKLYKKSFRDDRLIAKKIIIDAELMTALPQKQTASCSMDALTQLIEAYTSSKATPITDALALSGLKAAAKNIYEVYDNGQNAEARELMAYASLMSGICLANAGLGAVHGFAPALGITYGIPHGESCALLLDHVMRYNIPYDLEKFAKIGRILTNSEFESDTDAANASADFVTALKKHMNIPADLKHLNINSGDIDAILTRLSSNSMNANPVKMTNDTAREFIKALI